MFENHRKLSFARKFKCFLEFLHILTSLTVKNETVIFKHCISSHIRIVAHQFYSTVFENLLKKSQDYMFKMYNAVARFNYIVASVTSNFSYIGF